VYALIQRGGFAVPGRQVILMYHSVDGPHAAAVLGSFPIPLARFCHQVHAARRQGWAFGSLSRLREDTNENALYVTGDDGTVD